MPDVAPNQAAGASPTTQTPQPASGAAQSPPAGAPGTTPPEGTSAPTRAQRRAAAVARAIASEDAPAPDAGATTGVAPKVEAAPEKPPEPVVEQPLSPAMAQLARRDAEVRAREQRLKAEAEVFRREQHEAKQAQLTHEQFGSLARTNPVQLAEVLKLAPHERRDVAEQLFWSSYTDEERAKLPADYQQRMQQRAAQARPLTETDALKARLEKQEQEFKAYQEKVASERRQEEETRVQTSFLDHTVGELQAAAEKYPHVAAMLESDSEGTRGVLWRFAVEAAKADPEADITTDLVAGEYEKFLAERLKPLAKVYGAKPPAAAATAPISSRQMSGGGLSEAAVSAPTPVRTAPATRAERRAAALAKIERQG
jgi:hypothetical protein